MDFLRSLVLFFDEYPYWVRYVVVIWIVATAGVLAILVLARNAVFSESRDTNIRGPRSSSLVNSYYTAVQAGFLSQLDCRRFRIESEPGLITIENSACEALSELRSNMKLVAQYREAVTGKAKSLPSGQFHYLKTKDFFEFFFKESDHGPYKKHFLSLLDRMTQSGTELVNLRALDQLHQWHASGPMTVDDLFIGNSFLDWIIGTEVKERVSIGELVRLGPFYEMSFDPEIKNQLATREFRQEDGKPMDFNYIVGLYD
jgi:hypothetical protein